MGQSYDHITEEERCEIDRLHAAGLSRSAIAAHIGRHRCTISRELRRNASASGYTGYNAITADRKAGARRWRGSRLERASWLRDAVEDRLAMGWSPEIIAARLAHEHGSKVISHESIYRYIYSPQGRRHKLHRYLRRRKGRRGHRVRKHTASRIPNRVPVHDRPQEADKRTKLGHWEGDLMNFSDRKQAVLVLTERKTRLTLKAKLPDQKADTVVRHTCELMDGLPDEARKSITFDNGSEFTNHTKIGKKLGMKTYFCDPYAAWQKPTVENTIGRLRPELPRSAKLNQYTEKDIDDLMMSTNDTPRKCLDFQTPFEAFNLNLTETVALQM